MLYSRLRILIATCFGLLLFSTLGCGQATPAAPEPAPAAEVATDAETTPTAVAIIHDGEEADPRPLTVWLPATFYPAPESKAEQVVQQALTRYNDLKPLFPAEFVIKADEGQASLVNYLRSAQRVAPSILPDLIMIDAQQLWQVAELGLLQPITLADLGLNEEFYPFTLEAVTLSGQQVGAPYFADLSHMVYVASQVTAPPRTWAELIAGEQRFVFSAAGHGGYVDDWVLLQYLNAGGALQPAYPVNVDAATQTFKALADSKARGLFPAQISTLSNADMLWSMLTTNTATMASLPAHYYLGHQSERAAYPFTTLTATNEVTRTIGRVYAFAMLTQNVERQKQAQALLTYLFTPAVHDAWIVAAQWLPPDRAMIAGQPGEDLYIHFLDQQLAQAVALPSERTFAEFSKRFQQLVGEVLSGELSPEAAVEEFH